jgi:outer membrane protein assembly factor BamB
LICLSLVTLVAWWSPQAFDLRVILGSQPELLYHQILRLGVWSDGKAAMNRMTSPHLSAACWLLGALFVLAGADASGLVTHPAWADEIPQTKAGSSPETTRVGEDWAEFLGPRGTGVSGETGLLDQFPKGGPPVLWKKRIGTGYTAPSVRGNLLVYFHREQDDEAVVAITADRGEPVWRYAYPTTYEDPYGYNNGPRCTPLLTETRCYTFGAEGKIHCLDLATGKLAWSRDTAADFDVPMAFFGVGSTPILEGGRLIAMVGGLPAAGLVAFNAETGATEWQAVGAKQFTPPFGFRFQRDDKLASYSSPLAVTIGGRRQVLALLRPGFVSVDPATGEVLFSQFFRAAVRESVNAARPVVVDDLAFLSAAYESGALVLKARADGKGFDEVWRETDAMQNHWSTSLHVNGFLYGFSGRHESPSSLRCIDLKTGKLQWETADTFALGLSPARAADSDDLHFYGRGAAILAENKLIALSEWGHLGLVEVNPKQCVEKARHKIPELRYPSWTAPVLSRGRLYLRDENWLICLDLTRPPAR